MPGIFFQLQEIPEKVKRTGNTFLYCKQYVNTHTFSSFQHQALLTLCMYSSCVEHVWVNAPAFFSPAFLRYFLSAFIVLRSILEHSYKQSVKIDPSCSVYLTHLYKYCVVLYKVSSWLSLRGICMQKNSSLSLREDKLYLDFKKLKWRWSLKWAKNNAQKGSQGRRQKKSLKWSWIIRVSRGRPKMEDEQEHFFTVCISGSALSVWP